MDYEKKYKEALEKARQLCAYPTTKPFISDLQDLFHELKEGEGNEDERIKKTISDILLIDNDEIREILDTNNVLMQDIDNWLEKQGEQKYANKVKPKFNVGDWITLTRKDGTREVLQVSDIIDDRYYFNHLLQFSWSIKECNEKCHLWTIQDAKAGDVLVCKGNIKNSNGIKYERICLFNNLDNAFFTLTKTSNYVEEYDIDVNINYPDNTVPATKEQKEILFMTMKEAGYEWNAEKKELKKIEEKPADVRTADYCHVEDIKQNLAWSEADENVADHIISQLRSDNFCGVLGKTLLKEAESWLKSLKERVQSQPKQ